jgi:hypothetical protein
MRDEIVRTAQRPRSGKQRWCAYRKDYLAQQGHFDRTAISELRRALYHGNVDPVAPKVGLVPVYGGNSNLDLRMEGGEPTQARYQPPDSESSGRRDGKNTDPPLISYSLAREQHAIEPSTHALQQRSAILGQLDPAMQALEKARSEVPFECAHLVAHGALGKS